VSEPFTSSSYFLFLSVLTAIFIAADAFVVSEKCVPGQHGARARMLSAAERRCLGSRCAPAPNAQTATKAAARLVAIAESHRARRSAQIGSTPNGTSFIANAAARAPETRSARHSTHVGGGCFASAGWVAQALCDSSGWSA
jgi:hypothetical protein